VKTKEEVNATMINGARVRFIPESYRQNGNTQYTRSLIDRHIEWVEWGGTAAPADNGGGGGTDPDDPYQ
ncbi:MAG: DNA-binding protein, partial [Prevotellaceae bacterium]|nr:DNA-binding protein [Prevotellaceae bacterium]